MNTPPANGPGVAPPSGYTTSTHGMSSAAGKIHDAAEDSQQAVKDLKPTKLADKEFGTKHTQWFADYSKAIEALGAGSDAMCANLSAFAGQLGGAGRAYASADSGSSQNVNQAGQ